ncbi:MAG: hypothetical protein HY904_24720 [Deltaproteobacteria bacterium]|nr:hypothetical protein [Deltaproteobacteria bacterium]
MEIIDIDRLMSLRPAGIRSRLEPGDELLPLAPPTLLPALRAPLLDVPGAWGGWVQSVMVGASRADAPLCVSLDAEGGAERGGPRGLHEGVGALLDHARRARFRRPLVIHARLGTVDAHDQDSVDLARLRVLEAVDAGATSVQLGAFGEPDDAAALLRELLLPAADTGMGIVVQLLDGEQAPTVGRELPAAFHVDAWTGPAPASLSPRRDMLREDSLVGPLPAWIDATVLLGKVIRAVAATDAELQTAAGLLGLWGRKDDPRHERLDAMLSMETEELFTRLKARGSAGHAMVELSKEEPPPPFGE